MYILSSTANWAVNSVRGDLDTVIRRWWLKCQEPRVHLLKTAIAQESRFAPATIFYALYFFNLLTFIWQFYLSYRQYCVHLLTEKRPLNVADIISEEDYDKARLYSLEKHRLGFVHKIVGQIAISVVLWTNFTALVWSASGNATSTIFGKSEIVQSLMFCFIQSFLDALISTPFSYYDSFVIEEKFGFNKQTHSFFFMDRLKKHALSFVLGTPIICVIIWIIKGSGEYLFIDSWIFASIVTFLMVTIYPEFIAPLFDKYTPLPESKLKTKIEALTKKVGFPLTELYVVEGSKRSSHSNAYMYGFWKNKRIVLYDTLLSPEMNEKLKKLSDRSTTDKKADETTKITGMNDDEVVSVLGHELGHWKLMHSLYNLVLAEVNLFVALFVFSMVVNSTAFYKAFGFDSQPGFVGLVLTLHYILKPYVEIVSMAVSFASRYAEFAADNFSAKLGYASHLSSALIKLGKDNLAMPVDDWLYSMFKRSHPSIPKRIAILNKCL